MKQALGATTTPTTTLRGGVTNDSAQCKQHKQPQPKEQVGLTPSVNSAHSEVTKSTRRGRKKKVTGVQEGVLSNLTQQVEDTNMEEVTNNVSTPKGEEHKRYSKPPLEEVSKTNFKVPP